MGEEDTVTRAKWASLISGFSYESDWLHLFGFTTDGKKIRKYGSLGTRGSWGPMERGNKQAGVKRHRTEQRRGKRGGLASLTDG